MANLRMPDTNIVVVAGRLGQDPELKYTSSNRAFCRFSIANTQYYKDKTGEKAEKTTWINVTAWDKQAEYIGANVHKGMAVQVEGNLDTFTKDDGTKWLQVHARRVIPLEWADDGERQAAKPTPKQTQTPKREPIQEPMPEEDLPF